MKIKTSELTGAALDWAVCKALGLLEPIHSEPQPRVVFYSDQWQKYMRLNPPPQTYYSDRYEPSTDWSQGGPIIDREIHKLFRNVGGSWSAMILKYVPLTPEERGTGFALTRREQHNGSGPSPLIAAMRCFVASRLGHEVEIPEELM